MSIGAHKKITNAAPFFLEPANSTHRQYEALRAYFVDGLPSAEAARRFGYTPGSFRVLCHAFRQNPHREFFRPPQKGPTSAPKRDRVCEQVIGLRKQNLSIYDISQALEESGHRLSPAAVSLILKQEGFARLPRRRDEERPRCGATGYRRSGRCASARAGSATISHTLRRAVSVSAHSGVDPLDKLLEEVGFPGSQMVPPGHAMRALLALKLFGNARHSHVMSHVFDEGLALFAGLNVSPKRAF